MIKILILEDEIPARNKLRRLIEEQKNAFEIVAEIDTVEQGVSFLKGNLVDLIFSDIELLDGNSFEIFDRVPVKCPIIFITAYDEFWTNAFDSNGIAYLLKPYSKERFQKAWDKFMMFRNVSFDTDDLLNNIKNLLEQNVTKRIFKNRFTVHNHQGIYFLDTQNICFFEANEGVVFAYDSKNSGHLLNEATLKEIEEQLDPADFFRLNRSTLIHKNYIEKVERYTKNTLAVKLKNITKTFISSQSNTASFRAWLNG